MKSEEMVPVLLSAGFVLCSFEEQNKDLGLSRDYLTYLKRTHGGQFQCLWLTAYDGTFVESTFLVYDKPFNSRAKPPMKPVYANLFRSLNEILAAVSREKFP